MTQEGVTPLKTPEGHVRARVVEGLSSIDKLFPLVLPGPDPQKLAVIGQGEEIEPSLLMGEGVSLHRVSLAI